MVGNNLVSFLLRSRGGRNLFTRAITLFYRFGLSPKKLESMLKEWAKFNQKFGIKSSLPVTGIIVKRYPNVIKKLQSQNLDFALHGYTHIDYSFLNMEAQLSAFTKTAHIFHTYGIFYDGFRTPYTRWNEATMKSLEKLKIKWDSSKTVLWPIVNPTSYKGNWGTYKKVIALYSPMNAFNSLVLPELNHNFVEIPLSLPDDEMLIDRLKIPQKKVQEVWEEILSLSYKRGELFTLQLHPERFFLCKNTLERLIRKAKKYTPRVWIASLSQIAEWWLERRKFNLQIEKLKNKEYKIKILSSSRATLLLKNLKIIENEVKVRPWYDSYQIVVGNPKEIRAVAQSRPVIKIKREEAPFLKNFLSSEGYKVEENEESSLSFDKTNDKLKILAQIESSHLPIIRFWRWPYGARSCFSISGDIDALSLMDFFMRGVGK